MIHLNIFFNRAVLVLKSVWLYLWMDWMGEAKGLYHGKDAHRFARFWYLVMFTKLTF